MEFARLFYFETEAQRAKVVADLAEIESMFDLLDEPDFQNTYAITTPKAPECDRSSSASLLLMECAARQTVEGIYVDAPGERILVDPGLAAQYFYTNRHLEPSQRETLPSECASFLGSVVPIPGVSLVSDGQFKIAVDFMIGVDHYLSRNPRIQQFRILVIGSSSESGVCSLAYPVLNLMRLPCDTCVDLYDPYEMDRRETFAYVPVDGPAIRIVYNYHRMCFPYEDVSNYDLVFDDAYDPRIEDAVSYSMRAHLDPKGVVLGASDFSVKGLPGDVDYFSSYPEVNRYHQAFRTKQGEFRVTKYARCYGPYRSLPLGRCSGCAELVYMLRRDYSPEFYHYVMGIHNKPCLSGARSLRYPLPKCCTGQVIVQGARLLVCRHHNSSRSLYQYPLSDKRILSRKMVAPEEFSPGDRETSVLFAPTAGSCELVVPLIEETRFYPSVVIRTSECFYSTDRFVVSKAPAPVDVQYSYRAYAPGEEGSVGQIVHPGVSEPYPYDV